MGLVSNLDSLADGVLVRGLRSQPENDRYDHHLAELKAKGLSVIDVVRQEMGARRVLLQANPFPWDAILDGINQALNPDELYVGQYLVWSGLGALSPAQVRQYVNGVAIPGLQAYTMHVNKSGLASVSGLWHAQLFALIRSGETAYTMMG